jgi:predicted DNA-binding transcriptional regulator AlpA
MTSVSKIPIKKPTAEPAKKQPQPPWLRDLSRQLPALSDDPSVRMRAAHLLTKTQVCAITGVSFPTVWGWMRTGKFPRSRIVGGKSMWLSSEIEDWLAGLPLRPLKGDEPLGMT